MELHEFHFLRPAWLLALLPLAAIALFYFKQSHQRSSWEQVCDAHLLKHLLVNQSQQASRKPLWLLAAIWLLATIALAGPTWSKLEQPLFRSEDTLLIVMDLSRSMDANDLKPSRIELAKFKVIDLLKNQQEGQTGLIVYAAEPYVVSPLTNDADTIIAQIPTLNTSLMPKQGSRADLALEKAGELLKQSATAKGHILLITDGISQNSNVSTVANKLSHKNIRVSVLGVGTIEGAPIPLTDGGFLKDAQGTIVVPQLDSQALQSLALAGGGIYVNMSPDHQDIQRLQQVFTSNNALDTMHEQKQKTDRWLEQGPWLVLLLLPLAALAFRRGWLTIVFVAMLLPSHDTHAFDWQDLWLTPNQQAAKALQENATDKAAELFEDPQWKGTALYQHGDYEKAAEAFANSNNDAQALYNRGNALAKAGKLEEALAAYDAALKLHPEDEDAKFNRDLVQSILDQQQQQQSSENSDSQQNQQNQSEDSQSSESQQSQGEQNQSEQQQSSQQSAENAEQQDAQSQQQAMNEQGDPEQQEQQDQETQQQMSQQQENNEGEQEEQQQQLAEMNEELSASELEQQQAVEQWLRRVPDDPGGLLRRKFIREHRKQLNNPDNNAEEQQW